LITGEIHVWAPGVEETGGIQHYSRCLVETLLELYPHHLVRLFSKNDEAAHLRHPRLLGRCFGHLDGWRRTVAFAWAGLAAAWMRRPGLVIATHPHFAKALQFGGASYAVVAHGVETWGHLSGAMGKAMRGAVRVLPVSEFTRDVIVREADVPGGKICVVPDTYREGFFAPGPKSGDLLRRYGLSMEQPVLLTVGRLAASEAYKGQDRVIAALPAVLAVLPGVRYLIVGRGDDEARLRRYADDAGVGHAVIFAGYVPEAELPDHYRLCDCFVMPSTGEGFGIVYLEAAASGRPSIVGNVDASVEAIAHGELGVAVDPASRDALSAAILQVLGGEARFRDAGFLAARVDELFGAAAFRTALQGALEGLI
jgi:glycosyltransferase involved in cell wall biosynthesis